MQLSGAILHLNNIKTVIKSSVRNINIKNFSVSEGLLTQFWGHMHTEYYIGNLILC